MECPQLGSKGKRSQNPWWKVAGIERGRKGATADEQGFAPARGLVGCIAYRNQVLACAEANDRTSDFVLVGGREPMVFDYDVGYTTDGE